MKTSLRSGALAALSLSVAACGSFPSSTGTDVPAAIAVPSAAKLQVTLMGTGFQNYECRAAAGAVGGHDWVFVAPEAALRDAGGALVGKHYGGPTWEYGDGSKVTGKVLASSPAPTVGNIPWLLLQGTSTATAGVLNGIGYVQRVNTTGGTAPVEPCGAATAGSKRQVKYTADYLFYKS